MTTRIVPSTIVPRNAGRSAASLSRTVGAVLGSDGGASGFCGSMRSPFSVDTRHDRKFSHQRSFDRSDLPGAGAGHVGPGTASGVSEEDLVVARLGLGELVVEAAERCVLEGLGEDPEALAGARLDEAADEQRV